MGNTGVTSGEFIVRDGETVVAVLNNELTSNQAKQGDRFTLTVREPGQYQGAVIEGTVGSVDRGGRLLVTEHLSRSRRRVSKFSRERHSEVTPPTVSSTSSI